MKEIVNMLWNAPPLVFCVIGVLFVLFVIGLLEN